MALVSIHGGLGSGKTMFLAWYLLSKRSRKILANFKLFQSAADANLDADARVTHRRYQPLRPEMLVSINERGGPQIGPCIVGIQEAYTWLESRCSGSSDITRYMSYILFQSRKRLMDIAIDDQLLSTIDVRFRELTDVLVTCKKDTDGFHYKIRTRDGEWGLFLSWNDAQMIWPLYDTWETTDAIDTGLVARVSSDKSQVMATTKEIVDEILKLYDAKDVTHAVVDDYCDNHNINNTINEKIYNAITSIRKRKVA